MALIEQLYHLQSHGKVQLKKIKKISNETDFKIKKNLRKGNLRWKDPSEKSA